MKISLILSHPDPASFNHAIAEAAQNALRQNGHCVVLHDLYREGFDPVLPASEIPRDTNLDPLIEQHVREIAEADGILIVHPNWWGMPPAILKGWVDRVIRPGSAYEFRDGDSGEGVPIGLLKAKAAVVFNTSNTYPERERRVFGDPLETIWKNCIFDLCGVRNFHRRVFAVIVTSTKEQREEWLSDVRTTVRQCFPQDPFSSESNR